MTLDGSPRSHRHPGDTMTINVFLMLAGHHEAAWRLPGPPHATTDVGRYRELAELAERGTLDSVFLADSPLLHDVGHRPTGVLEPLTLLTALAMVTEHIGLIATASTSYNDPYNLARRFASLDHVSGGRAGWNIVTTAGPAAARNFGLDDTPAHAERYARAEEFLEVVCRLWDSWEDDVVLDDRERGVWGDASKVHPIDHRGERFAVAGPLNVPRSPQGRPLLVQAGSSEAGRAFAARHAEAIFTAQQTLDEALAFASDVRRRAVGRGRDPRGIAILPGIVPVIGSTEREARERDAALAELIVPRFALRRLADRLGVPVEVLELDRPLPEGLRPESEIETEKSRYTLVVELARRERLTVRELLGRLGGGRGHRTVATTPEGLADTLEDWFRRGAADGFNLMPAVLPEDLERFVEHVVPILRARGLFRHEYRAETLRERYGLPTPALAR